VSSIFVLPYALMTLHPNTDETYLPTEVHKGNFTHTFQRKRVMQISDRTHVGGEFEKTMMV